MGVPLQLDRNENLYGPAPKCFEALRNLGIDDLSVYSRDYLRGVKSRLAERLAAELRIPEKQVLLSEGSEDMLKQVVHCYVGPGEKVLCPAQSWWYYQSVAAEVAGETASFPLKEEGDRFVYNVDEIIGVYQKESPRVVLIASPNNPTGNSFPDADLKRLTEAFRESIVILDEAYWGFADESNEHIEELVTKYRNVLILRTFSKYFALAGARIGYAAAGASLTRIAKFSARYLGYNRISEALALAALDSRDYYQSIRNRMLDDRRAFYAFFDARPGYTCFRSDANFVLVRIPADHSAPLKKHLTERGLMIKFFTEQEFKDCVRITLGTQEQNAMLLEAWEEIEEKK
jgi:histidinol-phosphate aminotransferase